MLKKVSFLLFLSGLLVTTFDFSFASGTGYIVQGQQPTIAWSVTGASSCNRDSSYLNTPDGVYLAWAGPGGSSGSVSLPSVQQLSSGSGVPFWCTDNNTGTTDTVNLVVYAPPTASASCTQNGSTYTITLSWSAANASTNPTNYPLTLRSPSGAQTNVGSGALGDGAPTGTSYTFTGLTEGGTYTYGGKVWSQSYGLSNGFNNNNGGSVTCAGQATTYPDLTAGSITTNPSTVTIGVATTFNVTITNQGATTTGAGFTNLFQYATDSNGTGATTMGTYNRSSAVAAGGNFSASVSYTPQATGTFYVRACADKSSAADATGVINENTNEGNNCGAWTAVTVNAPAEPAISASCTLQGNGTYNVTLSWNSISGATNYPQRLSGPSHATGNSGGFAIGSATWKTAGDTDVIGWGAVGDAPTITSLTWTGLTAAGTYTYWGHAWSQYPSPGGTWSTDTPKPVTCPVPGVPDLTAANITTSLNPTYKVAGTLSAVISNIGSVSTGAGFSNFFQYSTSPTGASPVDIAPAASMSTLAGNSSQTTSVTYTPQSPGTFYMRACADKSWSGDAGAITESNEGNNCSVDWTPVTVGCPTGQVPSGNTCVTAPTGSCTGSPQTWLTYCSGSTQDTASGGQSIATVNSTYAGSATYTCSSGSWTGPTSASCTCNDAGADNFGGTPPCSYSSQSISVTVRATSPLTAQPSSTTTETFTSSSSDGANTACRLVNSAGANITGYGYVGGSPTSVVIKGITVPAVEGETTFGIKCRDTASTTVTAIDYFLLDVCTDLNKIWDTSQSKCVYPPDLTAGAVSPTTAQVNINTSFSGSLSNIGGKAATHFDYFFQKATGSQGTGTLSNGPNGSYNGTLNGGGQSTVVAQSIKYNAAGTYSLRLCADKKNATDNGKVAEWNAQGTGENNNCGAWTDICVGTAAQCPASPPQIVNPQIINNNTPNGTVSFSCTNTTTYSIIRDGVTLVNNQNYTGAVSYPITIEGNYDMICANGALTDDAVIYFSTTPPLGAMSLIAVPTTAKKGTVSTLSWSIVNPKVTCTLVASAVYPQGQSSDSARDAAVAVVNTALNGSTDTNDPYGQVSMATALHTKRLGTKAVGKKSVTLQYTTDFTLSCPGGTPQKVRINVTNENEG